MANPTPSQPQNRNSAEVIDLGRLLGLLLDNKWLIAGITTFFALAGVIYALCATPVYQADALVQVEQKKGGVPGLSEVSEMLGSSDSEAATEIELIKSRMIIGQTVDELNLTVQIEPLFPYGAGKGLAARLGWQAGSLRVGRFDVPDAYAGQPFELELLENGAYRLSQNGEEVQQKGKKLTLLAQHNPADLSIEALRNLRSSLHFAMMEARNNVLMVTGPSPAIGKTFITSNLAAVVAHGGQKVLLIDADMRNGHLHHYSATAGKAGLSDYLSGQKEQQQIITADEQQGFDFIARGQVPPNPSELLMHPRFAALLEWASQHYDLVLVDTPPLLAVTDAAIAGRLAGTVFLVARFGVTAAKEIELTQRRLEQNGIEVKGVILNAMEKRAAGYYGGSYGYYQYSYQSAKN